MEISFLRGFLGLSWAIRYLHGPPSAGRASIWRVNTYVRTIGTAGNSVCVYLGIEIEALPANGGSVQVANLSFSLILRLMYPS